MKFSIHTVLVGVVMGLACSAVHAKPKPKPSINKPPVAAPVRHTSVAEARLIEIYRLIGRADLAAALTKAERLTKDFPTFQLAHLVYGDLLSARFRRLKSMGDVPDALLANSPEGALQGLRDEARVRIRALQEHPPQGSIPAEFMLLSSHNKHAIAVDVTRSRLYLFENHDNNLTLTAEYYISIGKLGFGKATEGDQRTPLGVYFITNMLTPPALKDFYGSGALPINYPNVLDLKRGKTGKGIWLHGTPKGQFSRPPLASDGCVVMANSDLEHLLATVAIKTTPVVISNTLKWVLPHSSRLESHRFQTTLNAWVKAKSQGQVTETARFYASDFNSNGKTRAEWLPALRREMDNAKGRIVAVKDLSLLRWTDTTDVMLVSFTDVLAGQRTGSTRRQYWARTGQHWKIFFEGVL